MNHFKFILEIDIIKREKGSPDEIKFVRKKEKETVLLFTRNRSVLDNLTNIWPNVFQINQKIFHSFIYTRVAITFILYWWTYYVELFLFSKETTEKNLLHTMSGLSKILVEKNWPIDLTGPSIFHIHRRLIQTSVNQSIDPKSKRNSLFIWF